MRNGTRAVGVTHGTPQAAILIESDRLTKRERAWKVNLIEQGKPEWQDWYVHLLETSGVPFSGE